MEIMTFRQLEIFVQIARYENLTRAAKTLFISQSAASMALREFERIIGGPVFHRVGRGLVLNDRGRMLFPEAEKILASARELVDMAKSEEGDLTGELFIGCSTTIGNYFFPSWLKIFCEENPQVKVTLNVGNTKEIANLVREGALDIGLVEGAIDGCDLYEEEWLRDELVIIASPSHSFAGARPVVSVKEIANEQWILRERGSGTLSTFEAALTHKNIRLHNVQEIGQTEAIKRAVEAGMGLSCLSRMAVEEELLDGRLEEVATDLIITRWFRIISLPEQYRSRLFQHMMTWLRTLSSRFINEKTARS
ncbi:MAG TPA: LysR family transcriptional regulator [Aminobacterium sp.]|nr:LysR family transcriptional regulator [Aminobacterium sp.]